MIGEKAVVCLERRSIYSIQPIHTPSIEMSTKKREQKTVQGCTVIMIQGATWAGITTAFLAGKMECALWLGLGSVWPRDHLTVQQCCCTSPKITHDKHIQLGLCFPFFSGPQHVFVLNPKMFALIVVSVYPDSIMSALDRVYAILVSNQIYVISSRGPLMAIW